ncbi:homoserine dehydrogenase [Pseudomonadales bacterium]|nr:homoserine dehydrogenase [Pseudomonadales bacterium]MDB9866267.1 homoserine dehydrogenase [Pseudomonadales bacterium]MDB9879021.1 homoserine dehydrogenase [Pseudomonadales bacterium]MDC1306550.1 homoserine dehydrogenase [Pseudomonadales bacterium]
MQAVRVGICGLGTVGSGVANLLKQNGEEILRKTGRDIRLVHVGARRDHPDCDLSGIRVSRDIFAVANDPQVDIICELIGGTDVALELVRQAIKNGKHVVTANKALVAQYGEELFRLANAAGVSLMYEAGIAGGIPIVKAIREGLAGNRISRLAGIINGTSNYILTEMEVGGNRSFAEVLVEAQALGYAEADPTFDVEGIDAAHKLTILSSVAFGVPLRFDAIYTEGIANITVEDIHCASELGYRIKHLGITTRSELGVELRVHPTLVEKTHLLAQVNGVMNAVLVDSDAAGQTLYYGAGAGAGPTGSSVLADIIDIARNFPDGQRIPNLGFEPEALLDLPILSINETQSCHYLRLQVLDRPGVLARISTIMAQHNISIESLIQKDVRKTTAPIAIITDEVLEVAIIAAITDLEALDEIVGSVSRIRVESF